MYISGLLTNKQTLITDNSLVTVSKVSVDGELVKSSELFDEQLSLTELKVHTYICTQRITEDRGPHV